MTGRGFRWFDGFCGAGGSSTGIVEAGDEVLMAANHWQLALDSHEANHPNTRHWRADLSDADFSRRMPDVDWLWFSPACTKWSNAQGKKEPSPQGDLFDEAPLPDEAMVRSRATMFDPLRAIEAAALRGRPVLGGVVENVVDVARKWMFWPAWLTMFDAAGYDVEVVSLNSAFAGDPDAGIIPVPQMRNRMYVVFWSRKLGRRPDLDIRPPAWCPSCERQVNAVQVWKRLPKFGRPVGVYGRSGQYWYRCPDLSCRAVCDPLARPVADIIDWSDVGPRVADRKSLGLKPLERATVERMAAGLAKFGADPVLVPSGGPWNTDGPEPFLLRLRGGGDRARAHTTRAPVGTVSAQGEHHALVTSAASRHMVMSYYGNGGCSPTLVPLPTQPTKDRFALVSTTAVQVADCTFRMLHPRREITPAMGFPLGYVLHGTRGEQMAQLGNAVTPNAAGLLADRLGAAALGERVA